MVPEYGSLVGTWIVQERIGSGSHGVVFRAIRADTQDGRSYALKVAVQRDDARMEREVRLLSCIRHPSVPRLEGSGLWTSPRGDTYPYLVMEWVEGLPLYKWAEEHGLTLRWAIAQLAQVARALEATHRHGVHRDVKGGNVLVNAQGRAVLLDFGSGWYPDASPLTDGALPPGTEKYRSPRVQFLRYAIRAGVQGYYSAQPADDVYSLGVTAYRLLAGSYPPSETGSEREELLAKPEPLRAPRGLDEKCPELGALILRMLSDDPEARGSARQLAKELEELLEYRRPALDLPWTVSRLQPPTEETWRPEPPRTFMQRARVPLLAAAGIVLVLLGVLLTLDLGQREVAHSKPPTQQQGQENPEASSVGMGSESIAAPLPYEGPPHSDQSITSAEPVPSRPRPGQKRPPCGKRAETEINGGCWAPAKGEDPPCYTGWYEHGGRCYTPIMNPGRVPTSEDPP